MRKAGLSSLHPEIRPPTATLALFDIAGGMHPFRRCLSFAEPLYSADAPGTRIRNSDGGAPILRAGTGAGFILGGTFAAHPAVFPVCGTAREDQRRRDTFSDLLPV